MFDASLIRNHFSRAASHYDDHAHLQRVVRASLITLAKPILARSSHVLDLGAGTGTLTEEVKEFGWHLMHLDLSLAMCQQARQRGARVIQADAQTLPIKDSCFDAVFSSLMLQWVDHPLAVFHEMSRVLAPGGKALIATLVDGTLAELKSAFTALDDAAHVSDFPAPHALLEAADKAGFLLISAKQAPIVEHYPDSIALMRALKIIGAGNAHAQRRRGLMTPAAFARVEYAYDRYRDAKGLPATWQVLFLALRKI